MGRHRSTPGPGGVRGPLFLTEEEAHEHARQVLHGVPQALPANVDRQISLREYAERWLVDIVTKEAHTVRNYTERLTGHVLPALGHLKIRQLHRWHIKTLRAEKRRHTYASLLLAAGAPITYVSAQLGHANASTTLRYYAK